MEQKHLCQQVGQPGEESFELRTRGQREMATPNTARKRWTGLANKVCSMMWTGDTSISGTGLNGPPQVYAHK